MDASGDAILAVVCSGVVDATGEGDGLVPEVFHVERNSAAVREVPLSLRRLQDDARPLLGTAHGDPKNSVSFSLDEFGFRIVGLNGLDVEGRFKIEECLPPAKSGGRDENQIQKNP